MPNRLTRQKLEVTELLLESVTNPAKLRQVVEAMTALMGADEGMLASGRRSTAGARGIINIRSGTPGDDCFDSFALYRRWGLTQPPGKLYSDADIARIAGRRALDIDCPSARCGTPGARCMAHIDADGDNLCYVGFARRGKPAMFAESRILAIESLLPKLRHVYVTNRLFESLKAVSGAVMNRYERYHVGVVMVDEDAVVLYRNEVARKIFLLGGGLLLESDGRMVTQDASETAALLQSIREHLDGDLPDGQFAPTLLQITRSGHETPLSLAISPYRGGADRVIGGRACGSAVIMIYDPERPPVERAAVITQIYHLKSQEAQVVCALAAGASLEYIAQSNGRSLEAVRSQLKRILRKTGMSRQTELVKLVLSGPAAMVQ